MNKPILHAKKTKREKNNFIWEKRKKSSTYDVSLYGTERTKVDYHMKAVVVV